MEPVKLKLWQIAVIAFSIIAAIAAAAGCPVFRNPAAYATAGGAFASLRQAVETRRVR